VLKQFTLIGIAQLEKCEVPLSKLTTDIILSAIADPHNVRFMYFFEFFSITPSTENFILTVKKIMFSLHSTNLYYSIGKLQLNIS
jgi:hypothetical protein